MTEKKNGIICEYYNEELKSTYFKFHGKIEGEYKKYDIFRNMEVICNYKNNKEEGEYKEYYENGKLREIYNYINGYIID